MHTNAYKGGGGGLNMTKNTHFVRRCIENATISQTIFFVFLFFGTKTVILVGLSTY